MESMETPEALLAAAGPQNGWRIHALRVHTADGMVHVAAEIRGDSYRESLAGALSILRATGNRRTFVRIPPEADSVKDIVFQKTIYPGYVRFSFKNEPGELTVTALALENMTEGVRYLGLAKTAAT